MNTGTANENKYKEKYKQPIKSECQYKGTEGGSNYPLANVLMNTGTANENQYKVLGETDKVVFRLI